LLHDGGMKDSKALLQRFLPLLCAVALLAVSFSPHQEKKDRLRIVPGLWPAAESLLVAGDLQILPPNRFQIIEIPWASAVVRAFGSGAADVAVVTFDGALRMREAGQKLKVIKVLSQSAGADAVLARHEILSLQDLKGKRVGVERSAGSYLLVNALESAGMTMAEIEAIPMFQSEMEQALLGGQVEAVVVTEPWLTKLSSAGTHSLYDSSQLKVPIMYLLVASERACTSSREELVSLIKVQAEMTEKIWNGKPFLGMDAVLRRESLNAAELSSCLGRLRPLNKAENAEMMKQLPQLSLQMEEQMIRTGIIKSKPVGSEWIDGSFTKEALH
jgi:NitT/TauT family transport system substrate-binding protein